jgi:hypothetical protein
MVTLFFGVAAMIDQRKDTACKSAFDAYAALRRLEHDDPKLRANPHFQALIDTAYARFRASYEALT